VLLLFDSSDWSDYSQDLAREVFARPDLWRRLTERFVPVHIDFPEYPRASRRVQDPGRNEALQARFFKHPAYPRVVLTDAAGRPYACEEGYGEGSADQYVAKLDAHRQMREDRDELLAAVASVSGEAKLPAAEAALRFLANEVEAPTDRGDGTYVLSLAEFYGPVLREWRALADRHDPENAAGYRERFFHADWDRRCARALAEDDADGAALRGLAEEFDSWRGGCRFRDADLAADLLLSQARLRGRLGDRGGAERAVRAALALKPSPAWRDALEGELPAAAPATLGTGFAVAAGYVLTNHHVVQGPGRVRVRVAGQDPVEGKVVARDEASDLALLKVDLPAGTALRPLALAPQAPAGRGTEVMALGYALGAEALKFTRGAVSAQLEDPGAGRRLVLDQRVNPGNSGGPLCDVCGNVLGVVTAKTASSERVDSYGIAVPAAAVDRFLRRHLPEDYRPSRPRRQRLDWTEVDRQVSPSVVLVIKEPS
jgi:hypothetical protein